jgi:hypothetical protein
MQLKSVQTKGQSGFRSQAGHTVHMGIRGGLYTIIRRISTLGRPCWRMIFSENWFPLFGIMR